MAFFVYFYFSHNASNCQEFSKDDYQCEKNSLDTEGVSSMCEVAERLENRGEAKLGKLMSLLLEKGLVADATKAATDEKARHELYKKYGIE